MIGTNGVGDTLYAGVLSNATVSQGFQLLYRFGARYALPADGGGSGSLYVPGRGDNPLLVGQSILGVPHVASALVFYRRKVDQADNTPTVVLVDDTQRVSSVGELKATGGFLRGGPDSSWFSDASVGKGGMTYTYNNRDLPIQNYAIWMPSIPRDGLYSVDIFIPRNHATTRSAHLEVCHAFGTTVVAVDQLPALDVWQNLGVFYFRAGFNGYVYQDDVTGEPKHSKQIGFDSVRFRGVSNATPNAASSLAAIRNPIRGVL